MSNDQTSLAAAAPNPDQPNKPKARWTPLRIVGLIVVIALVGGIVFGLGRLFVTEQQTDKLQAKLDSFYQPPVSMPTEMGTVIRTETMDLQLSNAAATRMLYTSSDEEGQPIAVSGMVFVPSNVAPDAPVVAWAHPTLGQADKCAPSRSSNPLLDMTGWLDQMLSQGWIVAATDYAGLGTPGPKTYLMGAQSARDIVNSVRAAHTISNTNGTSWGVWGHSQGGQAALWTASQEGQLAPELDFVGVAAAAPAAELEAIMSEQWDKLAAWVIGAEAAQSFAAAYPELDVLGALTDDARSALSSLEADCTTGQGINGLIRQKLGERFFASDPTENPAWSTIVAEQTPPPLPAQTPLLLVQGTDDQVVISATNSLYAAQQCAASIPISTLWLGTVDHNKSAVIGGPTAVGWLEARFAGTPAPNTCNVPPPVAPFQQN